MRFHMQIDTIDTSRDGLRNLWLLWGPQRGQRVWWSHLWVQQDTNVHNICLYQGALPPYRWTPDFPTRFHRRSDLTFRSCKDPTSSNRCWKNSIWPESLALHSLWGLEASLRENIFKKTWRKWRDLFNLNPSRSCVYLRRERTNAWTGLSTLMGNFTASLLDHGSTTYYSPDKNT